MPITLCLNMIVKNEAANIERCLASIAPILGTWVVCDTGSTDDTPERIARFFSGRGIPGELHRFPFVDFGQARNEALDRCRRSALAFDFILFADADMELVVGDRAFVERLTAAAYLVQQRNVISYDNVRLLKRDVEARYVGVTHEYLDIRGNRERLADIWFIDHATGSNRIGKFERDARLLEEDLVRDPNNARNVFYLAQSYRDAGALVKSREAYQRRAAMGGWEEEVWNSLYEMARLSERLGAAVPEVRSAYLDAYQFRPCRAEPFFQLARLHRERNEWALAYLFARQAVAILRPSDILFLDDSVYRWRSLDELGTAAYWVGQWAEGKAAVERLLAEGSVPDSERSRIEANMGFYARPGANSAAPDKTPKHFRADSAGDRGVMKQIFEQRDYDLDCFPLSRALRTWETRQTAPLLVIDAGANIGASAVWFSSQIKNAAIVAIEPEPNNYALLVANTRHLQSVVSVLGAIGREEGYAYLHDPGRSDWGFQVKDQGTTQVHVYSMHELRAMVPDALPFIAKIDIEGGEEGLFAGNSDWLDDFSLIIIELHDWMVPGQATSRNFLQAIATYNFDVVPRGENLFCFNNRLLK